MGSPLQILMALTIGAFVTVNGMTTKTDTILHSAKAVANTANVHQLSTAVEMYYLDHNQYPKATDGSALVDILVSENYIRNRPLDARAFTYQTTKNGEDFILAVK